MATLNSLASRLQAATGRQGTTFSLDVVFVSLNETGTGQLTTEIDCPDAAMIRKIFLLEEKKSGSNNERIAVKAERDPRSHPSQK